MAAKNEKIYTACMVVIGDEILSGRTRDANLAWIAVELNKIGVRLREARVIPDVEAVIIQTVNEVRGRFDYVFTSGGIGPTHDDITADSVAKALGVELVEDERAIALLLERVKPEDLNPARRRMARIPKGAELVANPISKAPGFWIGNVIVMAGVPTVMQAMLGEVAPKLARGRKILSETIETHGLPEGAYGDALADLAKNTPDVSFGSYPSLREGLYVNQIVLRATQAEALAAARAKVEAMLAEIAARHRL